MRFLKRDDKRKVATVIIGRGYMQRNRAVPVYCPICREKNCSSRWFDVHQTRGKIEKKCDKCKWSFTVVIDDREPAGTEIYPLRLDEGS